MRSFLIKLWKFLPPSKHLQLFLMRRLQDQFLVGVTGIIFNSKNEILLFKHTYRKIPWNLPGGYLKGKEHPREGLEREIEEESGFIVSADMRLKTRTDRDTARLDLVYIGTYIGGEFNQSFEVSDAKFYHFENLPLIPKDSLLLIHKAIMLRRIKPISIQQLPSISDLKQHRMTRIRNFLKSIKIIRPVNTKN